MAIFEKMHSALKSLWDLENELRSAARNALLMHSDEAKAHMEEARRHYREALAAIRKELGAGSDEHATTSTEPNRDKLVKGDPEASYEAKHPNPGNVAEAQPGPMPSSDPDDKASELAKEVEKKRI